MTVQHLDLANLSSVKTFANNLQAEPKIDMLILNAGVAGVPQTCTKDNFELTIVTNHFGRFVLLDLLLGKLKQQVSLHAHANPHTEVVQHAVSPTHICKLIGVASLFCSE